MGKDESMVAPYKEKKLDNHIAVSSISTKKCWQCGTEAGFSLKECPVCRAALGSRNANGYASTLQEERDRKRKDILNLGYLVVLGTLFILTTGALTEACGTKPNPDATRQVTLELAELHSSYVKDPVASDEKYKVPKKLLRLRGPVISVSRTEEGESRINVSLHTGSNTQNSHPVIAYFSVDQETEIMALLTGQVITFEGKLQEFGSDGRLTFRDCTLLRRRVVVVELDLDDKGDSTT